MKIICKQCNREFIGHKNRQVCSLDCYYKYRSKYSGEKHPRWVDGRSKVNKECEICNKEFIGNSKRVVCSPRCMGLWQTKHGTKRGVNNGMWKGGRRIDGFGYVMILKPEHPNAKKDGYVQEHRLLIEKKIGRYLTKDEVVHHKDGIRSHNELSNLQLMTKKEHDRLTLLERDYKSTSGYRGVSWDKEKRKWVVVIRNNKKTYFIGRFTDKKEGALAYNKYAKKLHGKLANLNVL